MEIIVLPYIAVSFAIGWAVFSPFLKFDDLSRLSLDRITTSDLLAIFLPLSVLLTVARWTLPEDAVSVWVLLLIGVLILGFAFLALVAGLFLLDKMGATNSFKRMAIIGVIVPMGSLLSIAWIAFPFVALAYSVPYAIAATVSVVIVTLLLRGLSEWVCHCDSASAQSS